MGFQVYILRLANGQLYVGSTNNLPRRLAEHRTGNGGPTTSLSATVELLYSESHPDRSAAVKREQQIKRWTRAKKLALIKNDINGLKRLAQCHSALSVKASE
jgi:predicted GIY-YIG superfamily endonuclease